MKNERRKNRSSVYVHLVFFTCLNFVPPTQPGMQGAPLRVCQQRRRRDRRPHQQQGHRWEVVGLSAQLGGLVLAFRGMMWVEKGRTLFAISFFLYCCLPLNRFKLEYIPKTSCLLSSSSNPCAVVSPLLPSSSIVGLGHCVHLFAVGLPAHGVPGVSPPRRQSRPAV